MTINEAERVVTQMKIKGWNSGWQNDFLSLKKEYDANPLEESEAKLQLLITIFLED